MNCSWCKNVVKMLIISELSCKNATTIKSLAQKINAKFKTKYHTGPPHITWAEYNSTTNLNIVEENIHSFSTLRIQSLKLSFWKDIWSVAKELYMGDMRNEAAKQKSYNAKQ